MHKTFIMERQDAKETKGCYRYAQVAGDPGVTTIYLRKEFTEGRPPRRIAVSLTTAED